MPSKVLCIADVPQVTLTEEQIAAIQASKAIDVDRYGELQRRHELAKPDEEERKILSDKIQSWHREDYGGSGATENGVIYRINLSAKRNERIYTNKKMAFHLLRKALGFDALIALLDIPFGALDKTVPKSAQGPFVYQERSGWRELTVVALNPAPNPAQQEAA